MAKRTNPTQSKPPTISIANSPMFCAVLAGFTATVLDGSEVICAEAWSWSATRHGVARVAFTIEAPHADGYGIEPGALLFQSAQNWIEREAAKLGVLWRDIGFCFSTPPGDWKDLELQLLRLTLDAPALVEVVELETACEELEAACAHAVERSGTIEFLEVGAK